MVHTWSGGGSTLMPLDLIELGRCEILLFSPENSLYLKISACPLKFQTQVVFGILKRQNDLSDPVVCRFYKLDSSTYTFVI